MPAYNAELYISEAIESILSQSFKDFEFIIINDGSTDRTEELILSYNDSRIRYVKNQNNIKLVASLNKGIKLAKGEFLTRMDADDISLPDRLITQVNFMLDNPTIDISGGQMDIFGTHEGKSNYPLTHEECLLCLLDQPSFSNNLFIIKTEKVIAHNLFFDLNYLHAEDYKFYTDALKVLRGANITQTLTKYRQHDNSVTAKYFNIAFENRKKIRINHLKFILDIDTSTSENFYGKASLKKAIALKKIRAKAISKYHSVSRSYIDQLFFHNLWYKDALYESEKNHSAFLKYNLILLIKFDLSNFFNSFRVFKHYLKFNLLK
jgi:glycosyltransferase involved in cell wall biosynthesis